MSVATSLYSNTEDVKFGQEICVGASCNIFLLLPHFDIVCDLFQLYRRIAIWNLFVK